MLIPTSKESKKDTEARRIKRWYENGGRPFIPRVDPEIAAYFQSIKRPERKDNQTCE